MNVVSGNCVTIVRFRRFRLVFDSGLVVFGLFCGVGFTLDCFCCVWCDEGDDVLCY